MSNTLLKIIPTEPQYLPDSFSENKCRTFLENIFDANHIELLRTQEVAFIDPGQNLEQIFCNICGTKIDFEYWREKVDSAFLNKFEDLTIVFPCCGNRTSLNSLRYEWPAGFARFSIQIMNPNFELTDQNLQQLQIILDTSLRVIWAHY